MMMPLATVMGMVGVAGWGMKSGALNSDNAGEVSNEDGSGGLANKL